MAAVASYAVGGSVSRGFEPVRAACEDNVARRGELGGACEVPSGGGVGTARGIASFGSPGAGGSMGFADPDAGIGYGYVTSLMGTSFAGDPRDVALRAALDTVLK